MASLQDTKGNMRRLQLCVSNMEKELATNLKELDSLNTQLKVQSGIVPIMQQASTMQYYNQVPHPCPPIPPSSCPPVTMPPPCPPVRTNQKQRRLVRKELGIHDDTFTAVQLPDNWPAKATRSGC